MTINDVPSGGKTGFLAAPTLQQEPVDTLPHGAPRHIVMSPYLGKEHLLDLETLDSETGILAEALTNMRCLREDYATAPYLETFNWGEIVDRVRELANARKHHWRDKSFYIVAFRSRYVPGIDHSHLGDLDKAAHAEATASGGFLKEAVKAVRTMYAEWKIDQHELIIRDGVSSWEMIEWTD
ncbi:hypothetical protein SLS53_004940 [Cytospora paraplurivora]|uniref:Uncharacterized protein n=1 Tax=Cytospora paraplurivora TaxID=2898453 RepID=A0AAN9UED7_9PEZI